MPANLPDLRLPAEILEPEVHAENHPHCARASCL